MRGKARIVVWILWYILMLPAKSVKSVPVPEAVSYTHLAAGRIEKGTMPKNPVAVKSIVSTPLADAVAEHYGVELRSVLTGFKWIGDQIAQLEAAGEVDRFIFGFEESYGYLAGPYVRDKDAIIGSMLICEMAAYYRSIGSSLKQRLEEIYAQYGRYLNKVDSFEFPEMCIRDRYNMVCPLL